jgi:phosphoglycerate dehydrogenase-like enzyme
MAHPVVLLWVNSKVFSNLRLQDGHLSRLERSLPDLTFILCRSKEQFVDALPRAEIACSFGFKDEWFSLAPSLRRIISPTAGMEWFPADLPAGVRLETSTFHGKIIAETVTGMMLSHARGLLRAYSLQRTEPWPDQRLEPTLRRLRGSRLTILGFGHIGAHAGRMLKSFGVVITGLRRSPGTLPDYFTGEDRLLDADRLDEVLPETDHLLLCLPAAPDTAGILNARRLKLLPPEAGIYNVGRGNAVDEQALAAVLRERPLCEAYLDVFREEPLSAASPLRSLPNCLILPHVSANAPEFMDLFVDELIERLSAESSG